MPYTVYIKPSCPYSQAALKYITKKGFTYSSIDVDDYGGIQAVVRELKKSSHIPKKKVHNTVPIIFNEKGKFIGGFSDLSK